MQLKIFSVGDERPLRHFISDNTIQIQGVVVIGKLESAKDVEVAITYEKNVSKTAKNNFLNLRNPFHIVEKRLNEVLENSNVENLHLNSYTTSKTRGYTAFYETNMGE